MQKATNSTTNKPSSSSTAGAGAAAVPPNITRISFNSFTTTSSKPLSPSSSASKKPVATATAATQPKPALATTTAKPPAITATASTATTLNSNSNSQPIANTTLPPVAPKPSSPVPASTVADNHLSNSPVAPAPTPVAPAPVASASIAEEVNNNSTEIQKKPSIALSSDSTPSTATTTRSSVTSLSPPLPPAPPVAVIATSDTAAATSPIADKSEKEQQIETTASPATKKKSSITSFFRRSSQTTSDTGNGGNHTTSDSATTASKKPSISLNIFRRSSQTNNNNSSASAPSASVPPPSTRRESRIDRETATSKATESNSSAIATATEATSASAADTTTNRRPSQANRRPSQVFRADEEATVTLSEMAVAAATMRRVSLVKPRNSVTSLAQMMQSTNISSSASSSTTIPKKNDATRILTWNCLAPSNVKEISDILDWENTRFPAVMERLKRSDADIVCLQEIDRDCFERDIQPAMDLLGYSGVMQEPTLRLQGARSPAPSGRGYYRSLSPQKKNRVAYGVSTFFRHDKFDLISENHRTRVLLTMLKERNGSCCWTVINVHLQGDPLRGRDRLIQLQSAFRFAHEWIESVKVNKEILNDDKITQFPIVVLGDFNSFEDGVSMRWCVENRGILPDPVMDFGVAISPSKEKIDPHTFLLHNVREVARSVGLPNHEIPTFVRPGGSNIIDLMAFTGGLLDLLEIDTVISPQHHTTAEGRKEFFDRALITGLPNEHHPSDHIACYADFRLKQDIEPYAFSKVFAPPLVKEIDPRDLLPPEELKFSESQMKVIQFINDIAPFVKNPSRPSKKEIKLLKMDADSIRIFTKDLPKPLVLEAKKLHKDFMAQHRTKEAPNDLSKVSQRRKSL